MLLKNGPKNKAGHGYSSHALRENPVCARGRGQGVEPPTIRVLTPPPQTFCEDPPMGAKMAKMSDDPPFRWWPCTPMLCLYYEVNISPFTPFVGRHNVLLYANTYKCPPWKFYGTISATVRMHLCTQLWYFSSPRPSELLRKFYTLSDLLHIDQANFNFMASKNLTSHVNS